MILRKLSYKDIEYMIEWMNDEDINKNFKAKFSNYTREDLIDFINTSFNSENKHFAIVNEYDEYLGTVSLKNISNIDKNAEYAIVLRKSAIGSEIAKEATKEVLRFAFNELKLYKVYLNVLSENTRAIKFYEKMNFMYEGEFKEHYNINGELKNIMWYCVFNNIRNGE